MPEPSTHQLIDIKEIKEGTIILKNKNLRSILMVSSINFDLKSADEKKALVAAFQRFLNALDFTVQIVIHSRPLELTEYFAFLRAQQEKQENELLKIQTTEYLDFIRELVKLSNIMSKFFYVVIPYDIAVIKKSSFLKNIMPGKSSKESRQEKEEIKYGEAKNKLLLRVSQISGLLGEMGLRTIPLKDKEIIELFYGLYNPGVVLKQKNLEVLIATGEEEKQVG